MLIWLFYLAVLSFQILGFSADDHWYTGCFQGKGTDKDTQDNVTSSDSLVQCAQLCLQRRTLPLGEAPDCWAVYNSAGPYLTHVGVEVDSRWIVVNTPVHIEILAGVAATLNFSSDPDLFGVGKLLTINWYMREDKTNGTVQLRLEDVNETFHRILHQFGAVGRYKMHVTVSNGISSLSSDLDLEVIYPEPKDLQVGVPDYLDLPSCIPDEYNISKLQENEEAVLAVFVNTSVHIEASVAMGTNLTITFTFEDTGDVMTQICHCCTSVTQAHLFKDIGITKVTVVVMNNYGRLDKNITLMVVPKVLTDLEIMLHPDSLPVATINDSVNFVVSVLTTSRVHYVLELHYGDTNKDVVPIQDTNTSGLVLHGNGKDMDIIASYGDGCRLVVEFQYMYAREGSYKPSVTIFNNKYNPPVKNKGSIEKYNKVAGNENDAEVNKMPEKHDQLHAELEQDIFIVKEIAGLRLESERIAKCNENTAFTLQFLSEFNLTVIWTIHALNDEDDDVLLDEISFNSLHLVYKFTIAGAYLVTAKASNVISAASVSTNIMIQCPLKGLTVTCSKDFIPTGDAIECIAEVISGTDIVFLWLLEGPDEFESKHVFYENFTSILRTKLTSPGMYDIRVHAGNNISSSYFDIEPPIKVLDPINHIVVYKTSRTLLGNRTEFVAVYQPTNDHVNYYCNFDFDFGGGRKHIADTVCKDWNCYVGASHQFSTPGKHKVLVYGYNEVSEIVEEVEVWIIPGLDNVSVDVPEPAVIGHPLRFIVKENGVAMVTDNVYFNWKFLEKEEYCTNSPVVEKVFKESGDYLVSLNIINPVVSKTLEIPVHVKPSPDVLLLHDLHVGRDYDLHFTLKVNLEGPLIGWSQLLVTYSDGTSQSFDEIAYDWSHSFHNTGVHVANVTLLGAAGTTLEGLTSYIMVEEPITDLVLKGPSAVAFEKNKTSVWRAEMSSGSHVVYRWFLEDSVITTAPEYHLPGWSTSHVGQVVRRTDNFEVSVSKPGHYMLQLETWNDITPPTKVSMPITVENPIKAAQLQITGGLVGHKTLIQVFMYGFLPFTARVNFGDATEAEIHSSDLLANITSIHDNLHVLSLTHTYREAGEFPITANIFNNVSNVTCSEEFVPIETVTLTTRSPWVIRAPGHVVVTGAVQGGRNLQFLWDFADNYETLVKRYENKTSVAFHPYDIAGEYRVTLNVTGDYYPAPGVSVVLPRNFSVVDPIDMLELTPAGSSAPITNGRTKEIAFQAKSSGSHVKFVFDYGDGSSLEVTGFQLSEMYVDMTMCGNGNHIYTEVGVYKVKVTAVNPLSNMTYEMSRPFYVQEPPKDLTFHDYNLNLNGYAGRVGERIEFKASVLSGTNVTFDWKMGDQTDIVKAGPVVSHTYQTSGKKTVFVTAKNKVEKLERNVSVFVNYEIQGVEITPEQTTVAVGDSVLYQAVVTPAYRGIVSKYIWTFKSPTRLRGRSGKQEYTSRSSRISYTFSRGGWCTASVRAQNAISNATSVAIDIHVIEKIINLEIVVKGNKLVSQPIIFEYYAYAGGALNLTWSFGDGSPDIVTNEREVNHTFDRQAKYIVTLTAWNPVSSSTVHQTLFVLDRPYCNEPKVSILTEDGMKVYKSNIMVFEADITTDCNLTSLLTYNWLVKSHDRVIRRDDRKKMVLSPGSLDYGNYTVDLKVVMTGTHVYSNTSVAVEVVPSPLVSSIRGGVYRHVNRHDIIILDGSDSKDPDGGNFSFSWTCWFVTEDGKFGDKCFHDNRGDLDLVVAMDTLVISFPGRQLIEADNFTFTLTVSAPNKTSQSAFQVIHMVQKKSEMSNLKISCRKCASGPVNANEKLSFSSVCDSCQGKAIEYQWILYALADTSPFNPARAHDSSCVEPDGASYLSYILGEKEQQREATVTTDTKKDNSVVSEEQEKDFVENGDSDVKFLDYDDVTTIKPALPWDLEISEGDPSDAENIDHPSRRLAHYDSNLLFDIKEGDPGVSGSAGSRQYSENIDHPSLRLAHYDSNLLFDIKEGDPGVSGSAGSRQYSENIDHPSRRLPHYDSNLLFDIIEGDPGVSGSAGSRQYSVPGGDSARDSSRTFHTEEDSGSGRVLDFDKLEGPETNRRPHLTILDGPKFPIILEESDTKTGLSGPALVIKPGVLKQGWTYIVELKIWNTVTGETGEAKSSFTVNVSPVYGKCTVSPDTGVALETDFRVHCTDWREFQNHQPIMYEVSYSTVELGQKNLIYRGLDYSFTFKLPAGKPGNDYKVQLFIDILDGLLAKTVVCSIDVRVTPQNYSTKENGTKQVMDASVISDEIGRFTDTLQGALDRGEDAMVKVYIGYLASRLNEVTKYDDVNIWGQQRLNKSSNNVVLWKDFLEGKRARLLEVLKDLPVRDEGEILQSAQALSYTTAEAEELGQASLDFALNILKSLSKKTHDVYDGRPSEIEQLIPLVVTSASSIIKSASGYGRNADGKPEYFYQRIISESVKTVEELVLKELENHVVAENPIETSTDYFSTLSARRSTELSEAVQINRNKFILPQKLDNIVNNGVGIPRNGSTNQNCYQSHMTTFRENPYSFGKITKIQSSVSSLSLFDCDGRPVHVKNLPQDQLIKVELPNILPVEQSLPVRHTLKKWVMNIHQFNMTAENYHHALHLVVELTRVNKGRLFPITVLISHKAAPAPDRYLYKYDFDKKENTLEIFMAAGSLNVTGEYYIGIVDATYNSGRLRPGEITQRNYTMHLWWGECLYWHAHREVWLADGCWISQKSTVEVTKCNCNHLTAFGGHFELVPNKLSIFDVENFFLPHRNPVTFSLISVIIVLYCGLLVLCRYADRHDSKKGGIVYLLDNTPIDQQKYEITIETGFRKGAGTSAKISIILHGEEGMSETRELISDDNRPLFERNSRDKFILTLPDSIGKIWKVQVWHNNFGESPSWYLSRVIVKDLNTGNSYYFICEKWLAVEEQDGKVEREFMALEGPLEFTKIFWSKGIEYMADFHLWTSLVTRPSYSGFMLTERLTCCLTALMMYMCLNAVWYKTEETEYRGEFGLLDLSWRSITVGAICCGVVLPVMLLLQFLFRRSKPEDASSCHAQDEIADWEREYPSGKPNEQEVSEDSTEHVPPVMTYSLLDQSILNWPNIQHWAQKQWIKRQQGGRVSSEQGTRPDVGNQTTPNAIPRPPVSIAESPFSRHGLSELDQASSGFEDCSSLIRPKASMDSTHTTAAPSLAESTKAHRAQSVQDSLQTSKCPSLKTSKAPSISSTGSNKSSALYERKEVITNRLYLPFWCRYLAWALCGVICVGCAVVTIMYGFRFGTTKGTLWLQSLYFSMMVCVFLLNPILIFVAVIYSAVRYRNDPRVFDHYDIFNREKAKHDLDQWKKQIENTEEGEAMERGVAARQRSRYLRFARPPQEKQLIEARKKIMKEKKARAVLRETVAFVVTVFLLLMMAYSKDTSLFYRQNTAVKNDFLKPGSPNFTSIKLRDEWFHWTIGPFLDSLHSHYIIGGLDSDSPGDYAASHVIGNIHLRQQRVQIESCDVKLPYITTACISTQGTLATEAFGENKQWQHSNSHHRYFMFRWSSLFDKSGFIVEMENNGSLAREQIQQLQTDGWLDRQSRTMVTEFTLYNPPSNLFTSVKLVLELSPIGQAFTSASVMSTHLFRYVTGWDNFVLACELMFFVVMMYRVKLHATQLIKKRRKYLRNLWNILESITCLVSLGFCFCYIYRFFLVSDTVERFRSTYYEEFVDISFVAVWDEVLRSSVAILLFLTFVKSLRLLRYNKQFAVFGLVYRKARREVLLFLGLFTILLCAYTSLGRALFGAASKSFKDLWIALLTVSALLVRDGNYKEYSYPMQTYGLRTFVFTFAIFATGFLTAYMVAVLSRYFRSRKRRRLLAMGTREAIIFYWYQFQLWSGWRKPLQLEEPEIVLPPEFTLAEIEYQVEELLFRMNALTGTHSLPEKPTCYLTDSDCTYGGGDDGISSGGSEGQQQLGEDRLEQRVQKIEDNLCSQDSFLAQLLKLDSIDDDLTQEKEKQLRSHLELEIFRQLQIQRQEILTPPGGDPDAKGDNSNIPDSGKQKSCDLGAPNSPGHDSVPSTLSSSDPQQQSTSSGNTSSTQSSPSEEKFQKVKKPRSGLVLQTIHDLITMTASDNRDNPDNSSSNPDSPRDKISFARSKKAEKSIDKNKQDVSKTKSEKAHSEPKSETSKPNPDNVEGLKKLKKPELPAKPTFLQSREAAIGEGNRLSPVMKIRTTGPNSRSDSGSCTDRITTESSSSSEQDGFHYGRKPVMKRSLRKTKSRGKGKGPDDLEPSLILPEEGEGIEEGAEGKIEGAVGNWDGKIETGVSDSGDQVVTAEIHQTK